MKISVYDDTPKRPENELCLRLVPTDEGKSVQLLAVDPYTGRKLNSGIILEIGENRTIDLIGGCEVQGLTKDSMSRVKTRLR